MKRVFAIVIVSLMIGALAVASTLAQAWTPDMKPPAIDEITDPGAGAPDTLETSWSWDLGWLVSGSKYQSALTVENLCDTDQPVRITVTGLAELSFAVSGCDNASANKTCMTRVPPGPFSIVAVIESSPTFDWVLDPNAPHPAPRPYRLAKGEVVVYHPRVGNCLPQRDVYSVGMRFGGHRPDMPPPPLEKQKIASPGFCETWWNTGQRPPHLKPDQDCSETIRKLAQGYRDRILPPQIEKNPAAWAWLPTSDQISRMRADELVAMRMRAAAQIGP